MSQSRDLDLELHADDIRAANGGCTRQAAGSVTVQYEKGDAMRCTKLLVGLIPLPSLTLASNSTFAIFFTASGKVNSEPIIRYGQKEEST
ncbi:hypothetical protein SBA4_5580010 [Candidatus Sulfopaludibacter sp. SbA4]|nr:hypothetical protein SBA4_5580010 [Candidatus Sulfopaludibacter sp. SbA4]